MNSPTHQEARPRWRPSGDVETHVPQMSAAERTARARQAGAPPSLPPVPTIRPERSMAPAVNKVAVSLPAPTVTAPRRAPPSKPKPARQPRRQCMTLAQRDAAVLGVLRDAGRPMYTHEIVPALREQWPDLAYDSVRPLVHRSLRAMADTGTVEVVQSQPRLRWGLPGQQQQNTHAHLSRLVVQLRDERDALAAEVADLRARIQAARSVLGAREAAP